MKKLIMALAFTCIIFSGCNIPNDTANSGISDAEGYPISESPVAEQESEVSAQNENDTSPSEVPTSSAPERDTMPRTFYRYHVEDVVWIYEAAQFPPEWLETAKKVVDEESEDFDGQFTRGWQYDLDGDGRMEGILLFRVLEGDSHLWGNSFFVYISADVNVQILAMGQDSEQDDWRKMDVKLLRYQGFSHIFVRSGANNMTSQSFGHIYRESDGALEQLFSDFWFSPEGREVFFETQGPHGQGPKYYFWDSLKDRYSTVGEEELSPDQFFQIFDADEIIWDNLHDFDIEELEERPPSEYTVDMFESIEVYGNRYYQLIFHDPHPIFFAVWERTADGKWRYVSIVTGPIRYFDESITVYQIDMFEAEESAISIN